MARRLADPTVRQLDRYEGILIDTSGSIGKGGSDSELFRAYLLSTKKLLLSELPDKPSTGFDDLD